MSSDQMRHGRFLYWPDERMRLLIQTIGTVDAFYAMERAAQESRQKPRLILWQIPVSLVEASMGELQGFVQNLHECSLWPIGRMTVCEWVMEVFAVLASAGPGPEPGKPMVWFQQMLSHKSVNFWKQRTDPYGSSGLRTEALHASFLCQTTSCDWSAFDAALVLHLTERFGTRPIADLAREINGVAENGSMVLNAAFLRRSWNFVSRILSILKDQCHSAFHLQSQPSNSGNPWIALVDPPSHAGDPWIALVDQPSNSARIALVDQRSHSGDPWIALAEVTDVSMQKLVARCNPSACRYSPVEWDQVLLAYSACIEFASRIIRNTLTTACFSGRLQPLTALVMSFLFYPVSNLSLPS